MRDVPQQLQPPSWPPRVLLLQHGRRHVENGINDPRSEADKTDMYNLDSSYPKQQSLPTWKSLFSRRQARWTLGGILVFGVVTIILLSTLLSRHSINGLNTLFKKTCKLSLPQGNYMGQVIGPSKSLPRAIQAYQGIPYAESTGGHNRFRPPKALKTQGQDDAVYHALKFGQVCPQSKPSYKGQSENCLNANIYRPHFGDSAESIAAEEKRLGVDSKKLPVVVYVHGGGFNFGSSQERNMATFAAFADSPIITMSFNYRLGALGFLSSGTAARLGLLNLGLKDQQFFFEWMRGILPDIGGDPDNVTIMGLSAGAHSVGHHLISYSSANKLSHDPVPFQKAILESGGAAARGVFAPNHPLNELQFQEFLLLCGLEDTSDHELLKKLRDLPYATIVSASEMLWTKWSETLRWPFQPVIDGPGGVIPDLPIKSWEHDRVLQIPILTGFNTNEGASFVPEDINTPTAVRSLMSTIIPALNDTDLDMLDQLYPSLTTTEGKELYAGSQHTTKFGTEFWRLDDAYGHYAYICPVLQAASTASTASNAAPVYVYHYAPRSATFGAADHADEAPIVSHDISIIGKYPGLIATADAMTGAWTRFVATGDPNLSHSGAKAKFTWPRYISPFNPPPDKAKTGHVALFGADNDEQMGSAGTRNPGTPAKDIVLTEREMTQYEFWRPRVVLSQGYANGSTSVAVFRLDGKNSH
ncbi:alpha/beta-hydrolase [Xylaria nigripes]|nr:alpha/beta-hydrolase [Xylaria nigripes]